MKNDYSNQLYRHKYQKPKVEILSFNYEDMINTGKVENMSYMFMECKNLVSLNLTNFNTGKVTDMTMMFYNCKMLNIIKVDNNFVTTNVNLSHNMFFNCLNLVGGKDTTYDMNHVNKEYARIDQGPKSNAPGYFTSSYLN